MYSLVAKSLGGISFKGHIPEGDGIIMGLLLLEIVSDSGCTLFELVEDLLQQVGPAEYERKDLRLKLPVSKEKMVDKLINNAPIEIGGQKIIQISSLDGVKYLFEDRFLVINTAIRD